MYYVNGYPFVLFLTLSSSFDTQRWRLGGNEFIVSPPLSALPRGGTDSVPGDPPYFEGSASLARSRQALARHGASFRISNEPSPVGCPGSFIMHILFLGGSCRPRPPSHTEQQR